MVIRQGDIWWADFPEPVGSGPGFRRPVIVVQNDKLNHSRINTVVCVPLTSNLKWAEATGNLRLTTTMTGLPRDSVANVSQITAIDKSQLIESAGRLSDAKLELVLDGIQVVLGR